MPFRKGISGNQQGRPKGVADGRTKLRNLLIPQAEALVNKAVELALSGDVNALRLCIERLIPRASNESMIIKLPELNAVNGSAALKVGTEILASLSGQDVTIAQVKHLINVLNFCKENISMSTDEDQDIQHVKTIMQELMKKNKRDY
jgi:hypothetical protein